MKIIFILVCCALWLNKKPADQQVPDYCSKLDSLVKERYYTRPKYYTAAHERIVREVELATGLYGTYTLGFAGRSWCDTFFNNDIRRWSKYFNCTITTPMPPAPKTIPPFCDTTLFVIEE